MQERLTIDDIRQDYQRAALNKADLSSDPIRQFERWLDEARAAEVREPTAMALATASEQGMPSVRMVLLKAIDDRGFAFYTNLESRKGADLIINPNAALTFWWPALERQVRVEGSVLALEKAEVESYFRKRPVGGRIGAWASPQSRPILDRNELEQRVEAIHAEFGDDDIPLPPHWGGFRVVPRSVEFWQGRPSRLHDRFLYTKGDAGQWMITRLAP